MKYVFVREFNPAYDRFLMAYFKGHGLGLDENTTLKELENKVSLFVLGKMSAGERRLTTYMWDWGSHPECRPSFYRLLDKTLGGKDALTRMKCASWNRGFLPERGNYSLPKKKSPPISRGFTGST